MKCFLRRTVFGLVADDEGGEDALRGIKVGEYVAVVVTKPRNIKFHRLFWVMVGKLARSLELSPQVVADTLKLRTGHYTTVETLDGYTFRIPASISFSAMTEGSFREFFNACCREICRAWLPHMSPGRWRAEVLQMMGIDWNESDDEQEKDSSRAVSRGEGNDLRAIGSRGGT